MANVRLQALLMIPLLNRALAIKMHQYYKDEVDVDMGWTPFYLNEYSRIKYAYDIVFKECLHTFCDTCFTRTCN